MHSAKMVMTSAALGLWAFSAGAASIDPTLELELCSARRSCCSRLALSAGCAFRRLWPAWRHRPGLPVRPVSQLLQGRPERNP